MIHHLTVGAPERARLAPDDEERWDLLDRLHRTLGEALLGYCVMTTHVHLLAEGDHAKRVSRAALAHARAGQPVDPDDLRRARTFTRHPLLRPSLHLGESASAQVAG